MVISPGDLPGAHRGAPQAEALAVAVRAPELARPWVRFAPGVDDATRLGVVEVNPVVQRHVLERADRPAEAAAPGLTTLPIARSVFVTPLGSFLCRMSAAAIM